MLSRLGDLLRSKAPRALLAAAIGVAALTLASCDRLRPKTGVDLRTDDPEVLARGKSIYEAHCASCHGARLEGQPNWRERDAAGRLPAPPHDASGHTWHHPDQVLFDTVKYGVAKAAHLKDYDTAMPAYEGTLSDAEIVAVLSWIKSRWPSPIRKQQQEVDDAARRQRQR
jgi:mono/diheme cytochrome c family protein